MYQSQCLLYINILEKGLFSVKFLSIPLSEFPMPVGDDIWLILFLSIMEFPSKV